MATLRVRFKLNPGRKGIALGKLSKQTENIELFLRSLAADIGEDNGPNLWQAIDFKNGSVFNTAEYLAVVNAAQAEKFNDGVDGLVKFKPPSRRTKVPEFVSPLTIDRFANIRQGLDADEIIGIALFDLESGRLKRWSYVDRLQLQEIAESIDPQVRYVGAIMGTTYDWNKGAPSPYITIRELNSSELVKCIYVDDDYPKVARLFADKMAIVIIEGEMTFDRITAKTEMVKARNFDVAPPFSNDDYDRFFGCAPGMTGNLSAAEFISQGRNDD